MPQAVDYAALAKQAGAVSSTTPGAVDYAALAKQAGATTEEMPPPLKAPLSSIALAKSGASPKDVLAQVAEQERQRTSAGARVLPAVGGLVGGTVAGMPGAAAGGALGSAIEQTVLRGNREPDAPQTIGSQAKDIAVSGATQGALQGAGEAMAAGGMGLAKWLMNRATTRVTAQLAREFPELSDTLIDNALTVSKGGYGKAKSLLLAAKAPATAALKAATDAGATIPIEVSPEIAQSLKTALLQDATKRGMIPASAAGAPLQVAIDRAPAPLKTLFASIDQAAEKSGTLNLTPTQADVFKTQLQREARKVYLNAVAPNGRVAMDALTGIKADFAHQLNQAIDAVAPGYQSANAATKPLIGAVRGIQQAIRPSGNLYQAMLRPAIGAALGGSAGGYEGGTPGAIAGTVAGAALTSPAGMSQEAIILAHPAMKAILKQVPRGAAEAIRLFVQQHLPALLTENPAPVEPPR